MNADPEHPISFAFEPRYEDAHVKVVVRAGLRGMRGLAGELTMRPEEWVAFRDVLGQSAQMSDADERLAATLRESAPADLRVNPHQLDYHNRVLLHAGRGVRIVHIDATPFDLAPLSSPDTTEGEDTE